MRFPKYDVRNMGLETVHFFCAHLETSGAHISCWGVCYIPHIAAGARVHFVLFQGHFSSPLTPMMIESFPKPAFFSLLVVKEQIIIEEN